MRNGFNTLLQVGQNDYGYDLSFLLQDVSGAVVDLTGATLTFRAQLDSEYPVQMSGAMVLVDAPNGRCKYTVQLNDFPVAGVWSAQIVVTYSTEILTFSGILITVVEKLPLTA